MEPNITVNNIIYQKIPLLSNSNLTAQEKEELLQNIIISEYEKNDYIIKKGQIPVGLICLLAGKVKIFQEGVSNREQIVRLAKPGGFIGYRALFAEQLYFSTAIALENSVVCTIKKEPLFKIMNNNSKLTFEILRSLALELGVSNVRTINLTQKHVRGRLAEGLLFLIETYGYKADKQTINACLTREDIASLCNMTTSNAIRILSMFSEEKLIELNKKDIKIVNYAELQHISNIG
ncbi:MAG: Crp/Fnr family transcriptional regulator [Bacteroidales bacterium]|jgi:CRP-like cAMP-binding protein|nr:Crp/Fnr family transcriptional regulator [Bacteroidales bacterium]